MLCNLGRFFLMKVVKKKCLLLSTSWGKICIFDFSMQDDFELLLYDLHGRLFCLWWPNYAAVHCTPSATDHFGRIKRGKRYMCTKFPFNRSGAFVMVSHVFLLTCTLHVPASRWINNVWNFCCAQVQEMLMQRRTRTREALTLMWCVGQLPEKDLAQGLTGL